MKILGTVAVLWAVVWIGAGIASVVGASVTRLGTPPRDLFGRELRPATGLERWLDSDNRSSGADMVLADPKWRWFGYVALAAGTVGALGLWKLSERLTP